MGRSENHAVKILHKHIRKPRMKKAVVCIVSLVSILCFSWIPVYAVSREKPAFPAYIERMWDDIRGNYLLYDTQKRFEYHADEIDAFLSRTASLMQESLFDGEGFFEILKEDGIIDAAYIRTDGKVRIIGSIRTSSPITGSGYAVDDKDALRFVCMDEAYRAEAILNEGSIRDNLPAGIGAFFLYDRSSGGLFALTRGGKNTVTGIDFSGYLDRGPVFLKVNRVFIARPLKLGGDDVYIVYAGPFIAGYRFFRTAALIVLLVSAILLFIRVVLYSVKVKPQKGRGVRTMDEKSDIIREIDMEISDIIEEETSGEPKEAVETKSKKEDVEDVKNRLKSDGIIIKK